MNETAHPRTATKVPYEETARKQICLCGSVNTNYRITTLSRCNKVDFSSFVRYSTDKSRINDIVDVSGFGFSTLAGFIFSFPDASHYNIIRSSVSKNYSSFIIVL